MLRVNGINFNNKYYNDNNRVSAKMSGITFMGVKPDIFQKKQFIERFLELPVGEATQRLKNAIGSLPEIAKEFYEDKKAANRFFRTLTDAIEGKDVKKVSNAVADALNLPKNDPERDYVGGTFDKIYTAASRDSKYDDYLEKLTKNLYDSASAVEEKSVSTVESSVATDSTKSSNSKFVPKARSLKNTKNKNNPVPAKADANKLEDEARWAREIEQKQKNDIFFEDFLQNRSQSTFKLKYAVESLPPVDGDVNKSRRESNQFFRDLSKNLSASKAGSVEDAIGDVLGLEKLSGERMFVDCDFKKHYARLESDPKYSSFISKLKNEEPEVVSEISQSTEISSNASEALEETGGTVLSKKRKRTAREKTKEKYPSVKQVFTPEQKRAQALERKAKTMKRRAELDEIAERKLAGYRQEIAVVEEKIEANQKEIKSIEARVSKSKKENTKLYDESEFAFADAERKAHSKKLKRVVSDNLVPSIDAYSKAIAKHEAAMPRSGDFKDDFSYRTAMDAWVSKKNKLEGQNKRRISAETEFLPTVRTLRRNITELNKQYPSMPFIVKKLGQIKKLMDWEKLNQKDLDIINTQGKNNKRISEIQSFLNLYKGEKNSSSILTEADHEEKLRRHNLKKPIKENYPNLKNYYIDSARWINKGQRIFDDLQAFKRNKQNRELVEALRAELDILKQKTTFNVIQKKRISVIKSQRERLEAFLNHKLPDKKTGREYLQSLQDAIEEKVYELFYSRSNLGELDSSIANMQNRKQNLQDSISGLTKRLNSLKQAQAKEQRNVKINQKRALKESQKSED